jgi:hypothetical protein
LTVEAGELVFSLEYEPKSCNYYYGDKHHISFFFRCYLNNDVPPQTPTEKDINPDDPSITSKAKWVELSELDKIYFVPYDSLMDYINTGVFKPSFWEERSYLNRNNATQ